MAYRCREKDGEDLTPKLRDLLGDDFEKRLKTRTVMVKCSEGHENMFGPGLFVGDLTEGRNDD